MDNIEHNVEQILSENKKRLKVRIKKAILNAPQVEVNKGDIVNSEHKEKISVSDEIPPGIVQVLPSDEPWDVYVDEKHSHLFPWLYAEALKAVGFSEEEIRNKLNRKSNHEFKHLAKLQSMGGVRSKIGVSFYSVYKVDGKILPRALLGVVPNVTTEGELTIEEYKEVKKAPGEDMSEDDKSFEERLGKVLTTESKDIN